VGVDRRHDRSGFGATPPDSATADARIESLQAFADDACKDTQMRRQHRPDRLSRGSRY
jgi:hypothetical protein